MSWTLVECDIDMALIVDKPRLIRDEAQYEAYLEAIEGLLGDTSEEGRELLQLLIVIVNEYERKNHPIPPPDPVEALRFYMELKDLTPRDLEPYIGARQHVHDVLHGKRKLSISMIQRLHEGLGIPADTLIGRHARPKPGIPRARGRTSRAASTE